jgi:osmotically-inducible protein OsmY
MPSDNSPIPDETRRQLDEFFRLATEVDKAITAAIPGVIDLQVAAAGGGMVAISGIAPSVDAQRRAVEIALEMPGVRQVIGGLTLA